MIQNTTILCISLFFLQEPQSCSKLFPLVKGANNFTLTFQFYDRSEFLGSKETESLMNLHLHCSFEGNFKITLLSKECQRMKGTTHSSLWEAWDSWCSNNLYKSIKLQASHKLTPAHTLIHRPAAQINHTNYFKFESKNSTTLKRPLFFKKEKPEYCWAAR